MNVAIGQISQSTNLMALQVRHLLGLNPIVNDGWIVIGI